MSHFAQSNSEPRFITITEDQREQEALDLFNREVVGWPTKPRMTADLVMNALAMVRFQRRPAPGALFHSDRWKAENRGNFTPLAQPSHIIGILHPCWDISLTVQMLGKHDGLQFL